MISIPNMSAIEKMRESYKPEKVNILFIGESAPKSGAFFYDGKKHLFTTNIRKTFEEVFDINFNEDNQKFINYFKDKKCYLDDLSLEPVNDLSTSEKRIKLQESIIPLSERLKVVNPDVIVIIKKDIEHYVRSAIELSCTSPEVVPTYFPGVGWLHEFRKDVKPTLQKYIDSQ